MNGTAKAPDVAHLYRTDADTIMQANLNGTGVTTLPSAGNGSRGMAVDNGRSVAASSKTNRRSARQH